MFTGLYFILKNAFTKNSSEILFTEMKPKLA